MALEYLERLEAELQEGAPTLRVHQARVDSALEAISALLGQSGDPRPLTRADSISLILVASNYGFNPAGVVLDLTYREMMATGSLNHVRDREVRDAITRYFRASYRLSDVLEEQREAGVRDWTDRVAAATGGSRSSLRENPSTMGLKAEERLLDVLRADARAWSIGPFVIGFPTGTCCRSGRL